MSDKKTGFSSKPKSAIAEHLVEADEVGAALAAHLSAQNVCSCVRYPFRVTDSGKVTDFGATHERNCLLRRARLLGWNPVVG